jgi:hypothetical protein
MIAALAVIGMCGIGGSNASAQTCHLNGFIDAAGIPPGSERPQAYAEVWIDPTGYQGGISGTWDSKMWASTWNTSMTAPTRRFSITEGWPFGDPEEPDCEVDYVWNPYLQQCEYQESPIIIPLTSAAIKLTDIAGGVQFDHNGDGVKESTAWTQGGTEIAFLAYDANGNGTIDSGKELFGNNTVPGKSNGFAALKVLSGTKTGHVGPDDPFFAKLLLWTDRNHNGISEPSELRPASDVLGGVGLGYLGHNRRDGHGNLFKYRGWVSLKSSKPLKTLEGKERHALRRDVYDVVFKVLR